MTRLSNPIAVAQTQGSALNPLVSDCFSRVKCLCPPCHSPRHQQCHNGCWNESPHTDLAHPQTLDIQGGQYWGVGVCWLPIDTVKCLGCHPEVAPIPNPPSMQSQPCLASSLNFFCRVRSCLNQGWCGQLDYVLTDSIIDTHCILCIVNSLWQYSDSQTCISWLFLFICLLLCMVWWCYFLWGWRYTFHP